MARKKPERNIWQRLFDEDRKASYNRDAGYVLYGKHDELRTYAVPGGYETEPVVNHVLKKWIDALMAFDDREHHDAAPLIKLLLESDIEMLPIVRDWLADLAWRHNIPTDGIEDFIGQRRQLAGLLREFVLPPPTSGRPMVPAYDMSDRDAELSVDNEKVTNHLETHGGTVDDAIEATASKKYPSDPGAQSRYAVTLKNHRERRNTSSRRMAKRRT